MEVCGACACECHVAFLPQLRTNKNHRFTYSLLVNSPEADIDGREMNGEVKIEARVER